MTSLLPAQLSREARNTGIPFDLAAVVRWRVNRSAVERQAAALPVRRRLTGAWRIAWLLRAVTWVDLTTLAGDDTPDAVRQLCARARQPLRLDLLEALDATGLGIRVAAVCVYPRLVPVALEALAGAPIAVATVAAGFPAGQTTLADRVHEVESAVRLGAHEVDVVIARALVLNEEWRVLYEELRALKQAAGPAWLKVILATGELGSLTHVARASEVALQAGADFLKTSTGKEAVNATLPAGLVMARVIREFAARTGQVVGLKPAGGIRTAQQALDWLVLVKEELGERWLHADRFRLGASTLLDDLERHLAHERTGLAASFPSMPHARPA
ncbi:MAG: deoxyribose-phosphate aldolase [Chloroflexi bacterium]|nr:deoxyribose-phosphate aldolase [Chloroflexota bacterium]